MESVVSSPSVVMLHGNDDLKNMMAFRSPDLIQDQCRSPQSHVVYGRDGLVLRNTSVKASSESQSVKIDSMLL